eukprot:13294511-Heterocapsa_arctica.AAC.1
MPLGTSATFRPRDCERYPGNDDDDDDDGRVRPYAVLVLRPVRREAKLRNNRIHNTDHFSRQVSVVGFGKNGVRNPG